MPATKHSRRSSNGRASKQTRRKTSKLEILSSKTVFRGPAFSVTSDRVHEPNGIVARRDVVRHTGSAVILALDESGSEPRILLERQFRYAANAWLWELPAGRVDPGENALAGAKRELLEETGFRAKHWKPILFFYPSPGFVDETMTVFLARGLTAGTAQPEQDEAIECHWISLPKVLQMIHSGQICDGKTIAAALWLAEKSPS